MSWALGLTRILRPVNSLMVGLAVLIGEAIAYGTLYPYPSLLGFIAAFTLMGASMVANDYWDRLVDAVNAPNRPIASGVISTRLALSYTVILIAVGLSSALLTSTTSLILAIISLSISLLYSYRGKQLGLWGNFMVSTCIFIPLIYGGFLYQDAGLNFERLKLLLLFDLIVFLANTGREVNKGIVDVEGDKVRGVKTVAILHGSRIAAIVAAALYLSAVALSAIPWFLIWTRWLYLPIITVADMGFLASSFILLRDYSKESAVKVKKMILVWMLLGLIAFFTGVFG